MRNKIQQIAVLTLAVLVISSACGKNPSAPTDPGCTSNCTPVPPGTQFISIPAPTSLSSAFLHFHRPSNMPISDPTGVPVAFYLGWFESNGTYHRLIIDRPEDINWDPSQNVFTCKRAFTGDYMLPIDTEIEVWVVDFAISVNLGREIYVKDSLLSTKTDSLRSWPVGIFKLHPDGTLY